MADEEGAFGKKHSQFGTGWGDTGPSHYEAKIPPERAGKSERLGKSRILRQKLIEAASLTALYKMKNDKAEEIIKAVEAMPLEHPEDWISVNQLICEFREMK